MKRSTGASVGVWIVRLLLVGIVAAIWFLPPLTTLNSNTETARITDYQATMDLSSDGILTAVETIQVEFPGGKHGIYRIFDTKDERRNGVEHPISDVSVTLDGDDEPYEWVGSASGTESMRIGDAAIFVNPGQHTYVIRSTTTNAISPAADGTTQWWWNVIGSGWQMPMARATVTATLPAAPEESECVQGTDTPCTVSVEERTMTVSTGPLEPETPVTVRLTFPEGALPEPAADPSVPNWVLWSLLTGAVGAALGFLFIATTRERQPGFPVLFEPPAGVSPPVGARVLNETDSNDDLQALLYDLGERGVVRLDGNETAWRINLLVDPMTHQLSGSDLAVLSAMSLSSAGDSFLVSNTVTAGEKIGAAQSALRTSVSDESKEFLQTSPAGIWSKLLGWLAVIGLLVMAGFYFFSDTGVVFWPLLIGVAAFAVVNVGVMLDPATGSKHTEAGRDMWSRTGGFARFLTTDSSESRFDAAAHMDWYPRYLAWALVFGSAEAWARRFQAQGVDLPAVPWIYWTGTSMGFHQSSISSSFDSAISSASATYAASQSSSSGGGGFSGGSGGGGGGGGSW